MALSLINLVNQVKGILGIANGGTGQSALTAGLLRSSGTVVGTAELSGDATTSTSNAVTVIKVNGTTVGVNSAADQTVVTTASATGSWATLPNGVVSYSTSTHLFSLASVITGTIADNETPTGTIDGMNDTFTLAHAPSPAASLNLFKNGQLMIAGGADFTLTTLTIVYVAGAIPESGAAHRASYRY
jgi:hypothetical protein